MNRFVPDGTLGWRFWLLVLSATLMSIASTASTPLLPQFVQEKLGGDTAAAGIVISIGALVGLVSQPFIGALADRWGYKPTLIASVIIGTIGISIMLVALGVPLVAVSRSLFAISGATINGVCAAWVVAATSRGNRGNALGLYGLNVWIGLALGPQVGQLALDVGSFTGVWITCTVLGVVAVAVLFPVPPPHLEPVAVEARSPLRQFAEWRATVRLVALPGLVSTLIWSGEAVIMAYLIIHLESRGLAASGLLGAASVFTVFGISVVAARLIIGRLPDRLGALRTTTLCLVLLTVALLLIAVADNFAVAGLSAVVLGFAFAPLYPALTVLASENLTAANRGAGLAVFGAFTTLGMSGGALYGGILATASGTVSAFLVAAGAQVAALIVVVIARRAAGRVTVTDEVPSPQP